MWNLHFIKIVIFIFIRCHAWLKCIHTCGNQEMKMNRLEYVMLLFVTTNEPYTLICLHSVPFHTFNEFWFRCKHFDSLYVWADKILKIKLRVKWPKTKCFAYLHLSTSSSSVWVHNRRETQIFSTNFFTIFMFEAKSSHSKNDKYSNSYLHEGANDDGIRNWIGEQIEVWCSALFVHLFTHHFIAGTSHVENVKVKKALN